MIEALRAEPMLHFTSTWPGPVTIPLYFEPPQVQDTFSCHFPVPRQSPHPQTLPQVPALQPVWAAAGVGATATAVTGTRVKTPVNIVAFNLFIFLDPFQQPPVGATFTTRDVYNHPNARNGLLRINFGR